MKIWNDTVALGDTVCTFPAMLRMNPKSIFWTNAAVAELFPHEKYGIARAKSSDGCDKRVSLHDYVRTTWGKPYDRHPTQMALEMCGFWSDAPVKPELCFPDFDLEPFDLIIAPYVMADIGRMWPLDNWETIVKALGMRTATLMGSLPSMSDMNKIQNCGQRYEAHFRYQDDRPIRCTTMLRDRPLTEVAWYMSRAKLVITIDSGPARMMYGIGTPHLILPNADSNPLPWASYPGAHVIYKALRSTRADEVIERARAICG